MDFRTTLSLPSDLLSMVDELHRRWMDTGEMPRSSRRNDVLLRLLREIAPQKLPDVPPRPKK